jgi:hypothetical protein
MMPIFVLGMDKTVLVNFANMTNCPRATQNFDFEFNFRILKLFAPLAMQKYNMFEMTRADC